MAAIVLVAASGEEVRWRQKVVEEVTWGEWRAAAAGAVCDGRVASTRRPPVAPGMEDESRGEEDDEESDVSIGEKHCRLQGEVALQQEGLELLRAGGERFKQSEVVRAR